MTVELTAESTHEDITKAVDSIIEDRKGDAQIIAEERDEATTEIAAENSASSEDTAVDGDDSGEEAQPDWLDDDLKAEVSAYGIDEKELAEFTSREELERAMRFLDKSALEAGRKAMADGETPVRDDKGRFTKPDSETETEPKEGHYEISLDKDIYDEDLVNELTRMRDHYESRLESLESRIAHSDAKVEEQLFDSLVDSLGHSDLFGTTGKENAKQLERRKDLHTAVKAQQIGLQVMGRNVEFDKSLVDRVSRMVFAEDISKKELKAQTRKVFKQSNSRMGGGQTRPSDPAEGLREWARREYKARDNAS